MEGIRVSNIHKSFQDIQALENISFDVHKGELFGLIGPDGAGKTTLFRILTTLLLADQGCAEVCGYDVVDSYKEIRKRVGYMPGKFSLYQDLSVEENLSFFATIFGSSIEENYDLIADIYSQIEPYKKRLAGKLSGGMKQKLALSCALIHKPEVLFLDEPTTGVDAVSRKEFWEMLAKLKEKGIAILVSTPYMDEAELCDRIALIQNGRILETNTPDRLKKNFDHPLFAIKTKENYTFLNALREADFTHSVLPFGESLHLCTKVEMDINEISNYLMNHGLDSFEIASITPSVEDVFLGLSERIEVKG